jgi:hypothetical protein
MHSKPVLSIIAAVGAVGIVTGISFSTPVHALDIAWMGYQPYENFSGDWAGYTWNSTRLNTDTTYIVTTTLSQVGGAAAFTGVAAIHTPQGWISIDKPTWIGHNVDTIKFEIAVSAARAVAVYVIFKEP